MASKYPKPSKLIPDLIGSKRLLFLLFFSSFWGVFQADAQLVCKDEMLIDPYYNCGTFFQPVCACDGITYRNQCAAYYHGGIQGNQWMSGPCQEFFYFIYPTVCLNGNLKFQLQSKNRGRLNLYIINSFGKFESRQPLDVGSSASTEFDLDVTGYESGIYFLVIEGNNHAQIERFVVLPS